MFIIIAAMVGLILALIELNVKMGRVEATIESLPLGQVEEPNTPVPRDFVNEVKQSPTPQVTVAPMPTVTRRPTAVPTPTAAPTPTAVATLPPARVSVEKNICGRNPAVQLSLLAYLEMKSCRAVTTEELYRLLGEREIWFDGSPEAGDLEGLVNVTSLMVGFGLAAEVELPANTFSGMERLERLTIEAGNYEEATRLLIKAGAFQDLPNLKQLNINAYVGTTLEENSIAGLPVLETLRLDIGAPARIEGGAFQNLPNLERIEIVWRSARGQTDTWPMNTWGPAGHLPALKELILTGGGNLPPIGPAHFVNLSALERLQVESANRVTLNQGSFSNNLKLREVRITGEIAGCRNAFKTLDLLEGLSLSRCTGQNDEVALSPKSPLMKEILNGRETPQGYTVLPPGSY